MKSRKGELSWVRTCYGVDIDASPPVVVRADRTRSGIRIAACDVEEGQRAASAGQLFSGCMTARESFVRPVRAPYRNPAKSARVFPSLLDVELPFPIEECVCDFMAPAVGGEGTEALAVGCRTADLTNRLDAYRGLGLDPAVIGLKGLVLWRQAIREWPMDPRMPVRPRVVVLLSVNESVLVLGNGPRPTGAYSLRPGDQAAHLRHLLRARLEPGAQADWFWAGDAVSSPDHEALRHECEQEFPGRTCQADAPHAFLARALATGALLGGPFSCNLRVGDRAHVAISRRLERRVRAAAAATLIAGLVLCGGSLSWRSAASRTEARVDERIQSLASSLTGYPVTAKGEHAYALASQAVDARIAVCRPFLDGFRPSLTPRLEAVARCAAENGLRLGVISLSAESAVLSGTSGSWDKVDTLARLLERNGWHVRVRREDARDDGRIPFSIVPEDRHE